MKKHFSIILTVAAIFMLALAGCCNRCFESGASAKVALRNIRRDGNDAVKKFEKDGDITEDERKKMLDDIQKLTDSYIAKVDTMLAGKEKELMTV